MPARAVARHFDIGPARQRAAARHASSG